MIFSVPASFGLVSPVGFGLFGLSGGAFAAPNNPFSASRLLQGTRLHSSQGVGVSQQVRRGDREGRLEDPALEECYRAELAAYEAAKETSSEVAP